MIFNMSGGGGAALNFKVMGGTAEPSNPAENTIWIDTDAKITGWLFSSHQPENPAEGMVWIATGSASNAEFNALKKNNITVYPLSARQYVNGAWASKDARIYKDGNWKAFQFVVAPNTNLNWVSLSATVNKTPESTAITHTGKASSNGTNIDSYAYVDVDFTGYNTLYAKCTHSCNNTTGSDDLWTLQLTSASGDVVSYIMSREVPKSSNSANQTFENFIDVSALTGKYRFRSKIDHFSTTSVTHYVTITECRLY